jgi:hypothetical protein
VRGPRKVDCTIEQVVSIAGHTLKSATEILEKYLSQTRAFSDAAIYGSRGRLRRLSFFAYHQPFRATHKKCNREFRDPTNLAVGVVVKVANGFNSAAHPGHARNMPSGAAGRERRLTAVGFLVRFKASQT